MSVSSSEFRCGYVAIVGWPNVGKSTLLNTFLKVKLSIVSPKPQTTRDAILGILNGPGRQLIFVDTPGWLNPKDMFQSFMKREIVRAIYDDADLILWLLDPQPPTPEQLGFGEGLLKLQKHLFVVVNKADVISDPQLIPRIKEILDSKLKGDYFYGPISTKTKMGIHELEERLSEKLPCSPPFFPTDQITDRWERFYVAELIRQQIFSLFHEEVPHSSFVHIEDYVEIEGRKDHIKALIYVETEGQKGILIGDRGRAIKALGQKSRQDIEQGLGRPVFLELVVKVKPRWRNDPEFIKRLRSS